MGDTLCKHPGQDVDVPKRGIELDTFVANCNGAEYRLDKRVEGEVVEGDDVDGKCSRVAWGCTSGS